MYEFEKDNIQINNNYICGKLFVKCDKIQTLEEFKIQDMVYPGLNPDCIPLFVILSLFGNHRITINDWMFENRFIFLKDLLDKKLLDISEEISDVTCLIMALCNSLNLDLSESFLKKMAKNITFKIK